MESPELGDYPPRRKTERTLIIPREKRSDTNSPLLDPHDTRLPGDALFVRARCDIDSEADFAAFVGPLLLPGGRPHEYITDDPW